MEAAGSRARPDHDRRSGRRHLRGHHGTDNDMVVKLIDEYPHDDPDAKMRGYQLMTNMEIFRGRYLESFTQPTALATGSVTSTGSACTMWTTSSRPVTR